MQRTTTTSTHSLYTGSRLLESFGKSIDLPVDQVNFVFCQLVGLGLSILYNLYTSHYRISTTGKHIACLTPGVFLAYFCFGYQISNLLVMGMLCYIAIITCNPNGVQRIVLFVAIFYLSYLHLLRQKHDFGGYTVDITGPSMIIVQKVTSFAFNLHDGLGRPDEELTPSQRKYAIRQRPSLLAFMSYIFQFQSLLSGPLVYFTDYAEFIDGTNFSKHMANGRKTKKPSPALIVLRRLSICSVFVTFLYTLAPLFPAEKLSDEDFLNSSSIFTVMVYLFTVTACARFKYYFAWNMGEMMCNASGLGFNGYTEDGEEKWDLVNCVDILGFEFSLNFRGGLEAWNKTTQNWLKRFAYERASRYRTLATYILSAIWHGFYPGYYLTFLTGALYTQAARQARRRIRPRFQSTKSLAFAYDIITCIFTRFMVAYLVFPFILLEFQGSMRIYYRLYFYGHIIVLFAIVFLPKLMSQPKEEKGKEIEAESKANI